jgi:hypothetical protein
MAQRNKAVTGLVAWRRKRKIKEFPHGGVNNGLQGQPLDREDCGFAIVGRVSERMGFYRHDLDRHEFDPAANNNISRSA